MGGAVVGASVGVAYCVRKLVFDQIGAHAQHFIQNRARHRPEAVTAHFVLGKAHAAQGGQNGVVAHRAAGATGTGEQVAASPGVGVQFA